MIDAAELHAWTQANRMARAAYYHEDRTPRPCRICGEESVPNRRLCDTHHREYHRERVAKSRAARKDKK